MKLFMIFLLLAPTSLLAKGTFGLKVGTSAPKVSTKSIDGRNFDSEKLTAKGPLVLVFYRGGWCPYCNTQLRALEKKLLPKIKKYNATVAAISVDRADEGKATAKKNGTSFYILSDPDTKILGPYNVKYKVPEELVSKYKNEYAIDLEKSSGKKHHIIAVPAVYVLNKSHKISYAYVDENYKVRAKVEEVIEAVKKASK